MDVIELSPVIMTMLALLAVVIALFVTEKLRVDVVAILALVTLSLLSQVPGLEALANQRTLFAGFSSNAVIAIIGVMILGAGLERSGVMRQLADFLVRIAGKKEQGAIGLVSVVAATVSSFMQNIGAVALLMPAVSRLAQRTNTSPSRLLMPLGFMAILGGTVTLLGSSPLILLNDLLPEGTPTFGLFATAPVGLSLVAVGLLFFLTLGRHWLPNADDAETDNGLDELDRVLRTYRLNWQAAQVSVNLRYFRDDHITVMDFENQFDLHVIKIHSAGTEHISPQRDTPIRNGDNLEVLATKESLKAIYGDNKVDGIELRDTAIDLRQLIHTDSSGLAEIIIPPGSQLIGCSLRDLWMRRRYGLAVLAQHRGGRTLRKKMRGKKLQVGDALICYTRWQDLARLENDRNFLIVTGDYPQEKPSPSRTIPAVGFFVLALALALFSDMKLGAALLTGALGMVLSGVLSMDDAYAAVSWKTVFLLAGLIPVGAAMQETQTAAWIAQEVIGLLGSPPAWLLLSVLAVLATGFSLVMSNVGATVLLVPLAIGLSQTAGIAPELAALVIGISVSNSFIIPTHQVNALIMEPGGYRVKDYLRVGGTMTALFLPTVVVSVLLWY